MALKVQRILLETSIVFDDQEDELPTGESLHSELDELIHDGNYVIQVTSLEEYEDPKSTRQPLHCTCNALNQDEKISTVRDILRRCGDSFWYEDRGLDPDSPEDDNTLLFQEIVGILNRNGFDLKLVSLEVPHAEV